MAANFAFASFSHFHSSRRGPGWINGAKYDTFFRFFFGFRRRTGSYDTVEPYLLCASTMAIQPRFSTRFCLANARRFFIAAAIFCLVFASNIPLIRATDVKWQAATDTDVEQAHKAPRSQRYWDEHGIERPDYAKTDAELAVENPNSQKWYALGIFFLVSSLVGILAGLYARPGLSEISGTRLGSTKRQEAGGILSSLWSASQENGTDSREEKARRARLAHFEARKLD